MQKIASCVHFLVSTFIQINYYWEVASSSNTTYFNINFSYELSDGQSRSEKGIFKDGQDADGNIIKILSVTGQYSFVAPSGQKFTTFYTADEVTYLFYVHCFCCLLTCHLLLIFRKATESTRRWVLRRLREAWMILKTLTMRLQLWRRPKVELNQTHETRSLPNLFKFIHKQLVK